MIATEQAKKKLGRPTNNPKKTSMHVRLDQESDDVLNRYCSQEGVSKMEAARRGIKRLNDDLHNPVDLKVGLSPQSGGKTQEEEESVNL